MRATPPSISGFPVFLSRCTMSSALPWSAVTSHVPPTSSTALMRFCDPACTHSGCSAHSSTLQRDSMCSQSTLYPRDRNQLLQSAMHACACPAALASPDCTSMRAQSGSCPLPLEAESRRLLQCTRPASLCCLRSRRAGRRFSPGRELCAHLHALVDCAAGHDGSVQVAGVADHVGVRKVQPDLRALAMDDQAPCHMSSGCQAR